MARIQVFIGLVTRCLLGAESGFVNSNSCILLFKLTKPMKNTFLILLCLLTTLTIYAQTTAKTGSLADVSFMEGRWLGTFNGGPIEAAWIAPSATTSLALCG